MMSNRVLRTSFVRSLVQRYPHGVYSCSLLLTKSYPTTSLWKPPFAASAAGLTSYAARRVNSANTTATTNERSRQFPIERRHRRDTAQERRESANTRRTTQRPQRVVRASFVASKSHQATSNQRSQVVGYGSNAPSKSVTAMVDAPRIKQRWTNVEGSRYQRRQLAQQQGQSRGEADSNETPTLANATTRNNDDRRRPNMMSRSSNDGAVSTGKPLRREGDDRNHRLNRQGASETSRRPKQQGMASRQHPERFRGAGASLRGTAQLDAGETSGRVDSVSNRRQKPKQQATRATWFPPDQLEAYVSCHPGLESVLCQELQSLGISHRKKGFGATLSSPTLEDLMRCHLYLGTASHVFLRCGAEFSARALGELERKVEQMPWARILPPHDKNVPRFHLKITSSKSRLLHSTAIRDHVLAGIYKSLGYEDYADQKKENNRVVQQLSLSNSDDVADDGLQTKGDVGPINRLTVQFYRDKAQISIDTSSDPLHQRAYRLETAKAPLREDIAFAFLYGVGWKPSYRSFDQSSSPAETSSVSWKTDRFTAFLDPFCGSGTLPIEAAAMAAGLPPGRLRPAPFSGTCLYNPKQWDRLVNKALQESTTNMDASKRIQIRASDRDKGAVQATKANAERAGVSSLLEAEQCAFTAHPWLDRPSSIEGKLLIGSNLPFGRRLSAGVIPKNYLKHPLLPMYQSLANHLNDMKESKCQFDAVLLTDDKELLRLGGFRSPFRTALSTKHGGIPVVGMLMDSTETSSDDGDATCGSQVLEASITGSAIVLDSKPAGTDDVSCSFEVIEAPHDGSAMVSDVAMTDFEPFKTLPVTQSTDDDNIGESKPIYAGAGNTYATAYYLRNAPR